MLGPLRYTTARLSPPWIPLFGHRPGPRAQTRASQERMGKLKAEAEETDFTR